MRSHKRLNGAFVATVGIVLCLLGAERATAEGCNAYLFPQTVADVSLAAVRSDRLPILRDDDGCPAAGSKCAGKAYLVKGNQVFVSNTQDGYRCVAYFNGNRQTTGWVKSDGLTSVSPPAPEGDWADVWKRVQGDAVVTIRKLPGQYIASGIATYSVGRDNVRTGTADGTLHVTTSVTGAIASFTQNAGDPTSVCTVMLKQLGPWLLITDGATDDANSGCGGMGVTFNGIYQRTLHRNADHKP